MKQQLFIIFGKSGAGKNYIGEMIALHLGYYFYDADQDLTEEMLDAIKNQHFFTDEMRARYFEKVKQKIEALLRIHPKIVVTQGLFKNQNRHHLIQVFPFAQFIWIDTDDRVIAARVSERNNIVTLEYAQKINRFFEVPDFACYKIINHGDDQEILAEVIKITDN